MSPNSVGNFLFSELASSIRSPKPVLFLASASESEMNLSTETALDLFTVSHVLFADVEILYLARNLGAPINPSTSLAAGACWSEECAELLACSLAHWEERTDEWIELECMQGQCGRIDLYLAQIQLADTGSAWRCRSAFLQLNSLKCEVTRLV